MWACLCVNYLFRFIGKVAFFSFASLSIKRFFSMMEKRHLMFLSISQMKSEKEFSEALVNMSYCLINKTSESV